MDNLLAIKKAVILWLTPFLEESDEYSRAYVGADFSENVTLPAVISGIGKVNPILDRTNGLCEYDIVTETEVVLYVTDYILDIKCHSKNEEEAAAMAAYLVEKIRKVRSKPTSEIVNITRRFDDIGTGLPVLVEQGASKHWAASVYVSIRTQEAVQTDPGMVYKDFS